LCPVFPGGLGLGAYIHTCVVCVQYFLVALD
jgi:hypothetical protein